MASTPAATSQPSKEKMHEAYRRVYEILHAISVYQPYATYACISAPEGTVLHKEHLAVHANELAFSETKRFLLQRLEETK